MLATEDWEQTLKDGRRRMLLKAANERWELLESLERHLTDTLGWTMNNVGGDRKQKKVSGNEALSDVNKTLDGSTYPGWKMFCLR